MSTEKSMDRRSFLRAIGIGVIAGTSGAMLYQSWLDGECLSDGKCKKCVSYDGCTLPEKIVELDSHQGLKLAKPQEG